MGNKETLKALGQPVIEGWLGYEIINETMFFGRMRPDGVKLFDVWYSVDMTGYTKEARYEVMTRATILMNAPIVDRPTTDTQELIEWVEGQKYDTTEYPLGSRHLSKAYGCAKVSSCLLTMLF